MHEYSNSLMPKKINHSFELKRVVYPCYSFVFKRYALTTFPSDDSSAMNEPFE